MLETIFQNQNFVAIDKPAGMLSVPSRMGAADSRPCVGTQLSQQLGVRIWPIHRLDYEVSGLMLFALHEKAHRAGNNWFEHRQVKKIYQALSDLPAAPPPLAITSRWECTLMRGKKRAYESPHGKPAVTLATPIQTLCFHQRPGILWELAPLTGRSHQLRYEMFRHQLPIWGDSLYGSPIAWRESGIALRAIHLSFEECPGIADWGLPAFLKVPDLLN